jgi:hypothetical protein
MQMQYKKKAGAKFVYKLPADLFFLSFLLRASHSRLYLRWQAFSHLLMKK